MMMVIITTSHAEQLIGWLGSIAVAVELGDRPFSAVIIDQRFAVGRGGDERGDGGVIERAWQTTAGFVEPGAGVVGDERVRSSSQHQVVAQVSDRFTEVHWDQLVAHRNALIERSKNTHAQLTRQRRLTDQQYRARS